MRERFCRLSDASNWLGHFLGSLPRSAYATGILTAWQNQAPTGSPDGYNRSRSQGEAWRLHSRQP